MKPINNDSFYKESFSEYKERVSLLFPNWPECDLENWLYRHYTDAIQEYSWLKFESVKFKLVNWDIDSIYNDISSYKMKMIDDLGLQIYIREEKLRSWLQQYFHDNKTWPVPIIILDNREIQLSYHGNSYGLPYHLIEGHLRLGYSRNIYRHEKEVLKETHPVWITLERCKPPRSWGITFVY